MMNVAVTKGSKTGNRSMDIQKKEDLLWALLIVHTGFWYYAKPLCT
jgi:hypothetical protein